MRAASCLGVIIGVTSLAACGGGLSKDESARAWSSMNGSLAVGQAQAAQSASALSTAPGSVELSVPCVEGGSLSLSGTFDTTASPATFAFSVTFDQCKHGGIAANGNLDYALSVTDSPFSMLYTWSGNVDFSGDVDGSCAVDVTMSGSAGGFSSTGSICGHDVDQVISGWQPGA